MSESTPSASRTVTVRSGARASSLSSCSRTGAIGGSLGKGGAGVQPFPRQTPAGPPGCSYFSPLALDTAAPVPAPTTAPTGPATTAPATAPVAARWVVLWPQAV